MFVDVEAIQSALLNAAGIIALGYTVGRILRRPGNYSDRPMKTFQQVTKRQQLDAIADILRKHRWGDWGRVDGEFRHLTLAERVERVCQQVEHFAAEIKEYAQLLPDATLAPEAENEPLTHEVEKPRLGVNFFTEPP